LTARRREVAEVLRERARALAAVDDGARAIEIEELAVFSTGGNRLAVPLARVKRAARLTHLTEIPAAPPYLIGVTAVEGHLVSLLDVAAFLGLPKSGLADVAAAVVVAHGAREIGLAAERLHGIEDVPASEVSRLPGARGPLDRIARLEGESLPVLDVEALFADPRLQVGA